MSKQNRNNEYNRLVSLGREKDISKELMKEFGTKVVPVTKPIKKKQVK